MTHRSLVSCISAFLLWCVLAATASLAATNAPAPAPAPAPHAAAAPATAHPAAPATAGGRGGAAAAPLGRGGVPSGGAARGLVSPKMGSALSGRSAGVSTSAAARAGSRQGFSTNPNLFNCIDNAGNQYQSPSPCPFGDGAAGAPGSIGGDTYNFNLFVFMVPGAQRQQVAAEPGGLGGFAEATAAGRGAGVKASNAGGIAPGTGVRLVDPFLERAGLPIATQAQGYPVVTNISQSPSQYAIVLRSGLALATQEPPTRSGNLIVGHDRTGHLFSVRSTEVDLAASQIPAPPAAAPKQKP